MKVAAILIGIVLLISLTPLFGYGFWMGIKHGLLIAGSDIESAKIIANVCASLLGFIVLVFGMFLASP